MPTRRLTVPLACVLCALAAVLWHCRALSVPFLSDDYLMVRYLDRQSGAVHWDVVLSEFWSPWFGVRDMYRPLVSLSVGLELQLWGADPVLSHAVNLVLLAGAAAAVAFTGSHCAGRAPAGALLAGAVMALHPAGVEVTAWVAARTTGLEMLFSTLAMAFVCLRAEGRLRPWPVWSCLLLALLSKEGALLLPAVLMALDVVLRGRAALRDWRLHLPLWLLLAAVLLWRWHVLGLLTSAEPIEPAVLGGNLIGQVLAAMAPPQGGTLPLALVGLGGAILLAVTAATRNWRALVLLGCAALVLVPVSRTPADPVAWSGRLSFGAVPLLALALVSVVGRADRWRPAAILGAVGLLLGWSAIGWRWQEHYQRGAAIVSGLQHGLADRAGTDERVPLALLSVDSADVPSILLQPKAWYLLASRPFARRDHPVVGLACLLPPRDESAPELCFDLSPARAVLDAGGSIAEWTGGSLESWQRSETPVPEALSPDPLGQGRFVASAPLPVFDVAAVHVVSEVPRPGPWSLRLLPKEPQLEGLMLSVPGVADADDRGVWFDLERAISPVLIAHGQGTLLGCRLADSAGPIGAGARVELFPRPRLLPLPAPMEGAEVTLAELAARLQANLAGDPLQAVVISPATAVSLQLQPGRQAQWPPRALGELGFMASVAGTVTCWWFAATPRDARGQPGRSRLDRFRLRLPGK